MTDDLPMKTKEIEGAVYLCEWSKDGKKFQIRVRDNTKWSVEGTSFEEAEARLLEIMNEATGDMQPCFEYRPEPPKGVIQKRFEGPGIVVVSGANDPLDFAGDPAELFVGGICPVCKKGIGKRTKIPLIVRQLPRASDGATVRIRVSSPFVSFAIPIYSSQFIESLNPQERRHFEWLPVVSLTKAKTPFSEPISTPLVPMVMPKGLFNEKDRLQPDGFCCENCGRKELAGIPQGGGGIYTFVSEAALPQPLPSCFQVGQTGSLELCMPRKRWDELVGKPGTRRLMSRQVGVVKRSWVNPNPNLEVLPKQTSNCGSK